MNSTVLYASVVSLALLLVLIAPRSRRRSSGVVVEPPAALRELGWALLMLSNTILVESWSPSKLAIWVVSLVVFMLVVTFVLLPKSYRGAAVWETASELRVASGGTARCGDVRLDGWLSGPALEAVVLAPETRDRLVAFVTARGTLEAGELRLPLGPRPAEAELAEADALLVALREALDAEVTLERLLERWRSDPVDGVRVRVAELAVGLTRPPLVTALRQALQDALGLPTAEALADAIPDLPEHERIVAVDALSRVATRPEHLALLRRHVDAPDLWAVRRRLTRAAAPVAGREGRLSLPHDPYDGGLSVAEPAGGLTPVRPARGQTDRS
jgi:hypothetical protein